MNWRRGLLLLVGCWGHLSLAAPLELGYQGRLLDSSGTPIEGTKTITFALYHDADVSDPSQEPTATPAWTEDQQLGLSAGFYATQLGVVTPLTSDLFDGEPLWLLLTVDGEPLLPLQKVTSVAYAVQADTATNVQGGVVDASSIHVASGGSITVGGTEVIDAGGQISLSNALPGCQSDGQVLKWLGSQWVCAADADTDTTYEAGTGITITGPSNTIAATLGSDIDSSEIVDGTIVAADVDTSSVQVRVSGACGPGSAVASVGADGSVTCVPTHRLGASANIVTGIVVNVSGTCTTKAPPPHMKVFVNQEPVGEADITWTTLADTGTFTLNPPVYASEVAVAFTNDSQAGGCDHNITVDHVNLITANGTIVLSPTDTEHAIYDVSAFFDNKNVRPAQKVMGWTGALRFFLSPMPDLNTREWFLAAGSSSTWVGASAATWTYVTGLDVVKGTAASYYDATTGRFTAPSTGLYHCFVKPYKSYQSAGYHHTVSTCFAPGDPATERVCNGFPAYDYSLGGTDGTAHQDGTGANQGYFYLQRGEQIAWRVYTNVNNAYVYYPDYTRSGCVKLSN